MALRLAVAVSQAPGLGGTPSARHRSTAVANASATASSAMSRSPKRLVRAATTRAHSSWWSLRSHGVLALGSGDGHLPDLPPACHYPRCFDRRGRQRFHLPSLSSRLHPRFQWRLLGLPLAA